MSTDADVWNDPSAQVGGDFVQWENPGDSVSGTVVEVRFGEDFNGNKCPELVIATATGEKIVTAGQVRLKAELLEARPVRGEHITITLTQVEPRPGGRTLKHFSVLKGGAVAAPAGIPAAPAVASSPAPAATPATPAPAPAAAGVDPAQAAAALAALTPEQRAALGIPS